MTPRKKLTEEEKDALLVQRVRELEKAARHPQTDGMALRVVKDASTDMETLWNRRTWYKTMSIFSNRTEVQQARGLDEVSRSEDDNPRIDERLIPDYRTIPEDVLIEEEMREDIFTLLKLLTPRQARCIELYYLADFSQQDIADQLGIGQRVVSQHINAGLSRLRKKILGDPAKLPLKSPTSRLIIEEGTTSFWSLMMQCRIARAMHHKRVPFAVEGGVRTPHDDWTHFFTYRCNQTCPKYPCHIVQEKKGYKFCNRGPEYEAAVVGIPYLLYAHQLKLNKMWLAATQNRLDASGHARYVKSLEWFRLNRGLVTKRYVATVLKCRDRAEALNYLEVRAREIIQSGADTLQIVNALEKKRLPTRLQINCESGIVRVDSMPQHGLLPRAKTDWVPPDHSSGIPGATRICSMRQRNRRCRRIKAPEWLQLGAVAARWEKDSLHEVFILDYPSTGGQNTCAPREGGGG